MKTVTVETFGQEYPQPKTKTLMPSGAFLLNGQPPTTYLRPPLPWQEFPQSGRIVRPDPNGK